MICMYSRIWVLQRGNRIGKDSVKLYFFFFDFISFWIVLLRETNYDDDYSEREAGHGTKTVLYYMAFLFLSHKRFFVYDTIDNDIESVLHSIKEGKLDIYMANHRI